MTKTTSLCPIYIMEAMLGFRSKEFKESMQLPELSRGVPEPVPVGWVRGVKGCLYPRVCLKKSHKCPVNPVYFRLLLYSVKNKDRKYYKTSQALVLEILVENWEKCGMPYQRETKRNIVGVPVNSVIKKWSNIKNIWPKCHLNKDN